VWRGECLDTSDRRQAQTGVDYHVAGVPHVPSCLGGHVYPHTPAESLVGQSRNTDQGASPPPIVAVYRRSLSQSPSRVSAAPGTRAWLRTPARLVWASSCGHRRDRPSRVGAPRFPPIQRCSFRPLGFIRMILVCRRPPPEPNGQARVHTGRAKPSPKDWNSWRFDSTVPQ
jgi:hypothetical protein